MDETLENKILIELGRINMSMHEMGVKMGSMENRMTSMEDRMTSMEDRMTSMEEKMDRFQSENQADHRAIMGDLTTLISIVDKKYETKILDLQKSIQNGK